MNTRIQSMLWIWIIWSVLCAGVSVVMFGLNHYAKSHTWRADFTYLASAQNSPPPILGDCATTSNLLSQYCYRLKLYFPSNIFRAQKDITLLADKETLELHTSPALSQDSITQIKHALLFDKNRILLTTDTILDEITGSITYTIEIHLYKKIFVIWLLISVIIIVWRAGPLYYHKIQSLATKCLVHVDTPYAPFVESNSYTTSSNHMQADSTRSAKLIFLLCFGVFVIGFGLRFGYMLQKVDLHGDEAWSIAITSNSHRCLWGGTCEDGVWYGKEAKERELWHDKSFSNALADIANLYLTNNGDSHSHADLYYILLRLWHIGVQTGDLDWIIQRAVGLNLFVFYPLACLFAFLLGRRLFGTGYALVAFLALAMLNGASISTSMLMREYALQQCMFLGFAWIMVRLYCKESLTKVDYVLGAIITACLLLSGYFTILFVVVAFGAMWFLSSGRDVKHSGQVSRARSLAQIAILSLICTFALYPIYHKGFLGGHAQSAVDKVGDSLQNFLESMHVYGQILLQDIFTPLLLCAMAMVAIWIAIKAWANKASLSGALGVGYFSSRECFLAFGLGILALGFGVVVMYLAPWKILRFVMAVFPLVSLLIVLPFTPLLERKNLLSKCILLLFGLSLALYHNVGFLRYPHYENFSSEPIYQMEPILSKELSDNYTIPTIYNHADDYLATRAIPYFHDLRLYHFVKDSRQALERVRAFDECFFITRLPLETIQEYLGNEYKVHFTQRAFAIMRYHITKTTER